MRRILGIDPGLKVTGWGVIAQQGSGLHYVASGTIETKQGDSVPARLAQLSRGLEEVIAHHTPDCVAIEESFVNNNAASSLKLGQARGALIVTAARKQLPIDEYAPRLVKKAITGVGSADKDQVLAMVRVLFPGVKVQKADEADALAIATCHANHASLVKA